MDSRYRVYSQYLRDRYGEKVYKLPINLPVTCPNRDGTVGKSGCIFCGEEGAGFEDLSNTLSVGEQLEINMDYISRKYKAQKFIAYFQNFTNTYLPLEKFQQYSQEACLPQIVELAISTRPDCINESYLDYLQFLKEKNNINISIELGLQTVNYHTLKKINRGHTLAEFIDAVRRIKRKELEVCAHLILNFPWDQMADVVENAKILSALQVEQVKLHSLYIVKDTVLAKLYEEGQISFFSKEEYIERVVTFLEYLDPSVIIQRLIGRAPEENTIFVNWNTSWWKIRDSIEALLEERATYQGKKFNYLNGSALRNFDN